MIFMRAIISFLLAFAIQNYPPGFLFNQTTDRILIINSFDAQSIQARKNKKELFAELADSLKYMLQTEFSRKKDREVIVAPEFGSNPTGKDNIYTGLLNKYAASKAIVIKNLNAYFVQTDVEVTKEADGKKRVASYNINADVNYILYDTTGIVKESEIKVWEFFTERNVVSGLLASGPDIVGKSKHAFKIIQKNAEQYRREAESFLQKD